MTGDLLMQHAVIVRDAGGKEFDGWETAGHHVMRLVGERVRTLSPDVVHRTNFVDVRNEHEQRMMTVTVFAAAERIAPDPSAESHFGSWIAYFRGMPFMKPVWAQVG